MPAPQPISPDPRRAAAAGDLLETWKEIAVYLSRDLRTVKRWEASRGLPVHRLPGGPKAAVYALKSEVDAWRRGAGAKVESGERVVPRAKPAWMWIAATATLAIAAGVFVFLRRSSTPVPPPHLTRLTNYRGVEWFPSFSPDGSQIAFSWNGEHEDNYDIYVQLVNLGNPVRITSDPAMDLAPAWSPDGRFLAFFRWALGATKVEWFVVPALGGAERKVDEAAITPNAIALPFPAIAWTPDGERLIRGSPEGLVLISVGTGTVMHLTTPLAQSPGDCCPAVSPDGRTLAFLRASAARSYSPVVVDIARDGNARSEPRALASLPCVNPLWSAGAAEVLCVAGSGAERTLWRIPVQGKGEPRAVPSIGALGEHLAIAPRNNLLVYSNSSWEGDIWELTVGQKQPPVRRLASTADDFMPQFSPDGAKIAFLSSRSGRLAVWVADRSGANASLLVPSAAPNAIAWSPDGQQIAYTCRGERKLEDICAVRSTGGAPRQFTKGPGRNMLPAWSHDGRWIYFASDRTGTFQTWRAPADSSGPPTQVTRKGGFGGIESTDGRFFYYGNTMMSSPLFRVPAAGGEEVPVGAEIASLRLPNNFAVAPDRIYFASAKDPSRQFDLRFYSFSTGKAEIIARIDGGLGNGMSVSPDGRTLLFTVEQHSGDLVMVENFR